MSEPWNETIAYSLNAWDCPGCGWVNTTDADLSEVETCEDCNKDFYIK